MEDSGLDAYSEWLNETLFNAQREETETLVWAGDNRWLLISTDGPAEIFQITIKRVELKEV